MAVCYCARPVDDTPGAGALVGLKSLKSCSRIRLAQVCAHDQWVGYSGIRVDATATASDRSLSLLANLFFWR